MLTNRSYFVAAACALLLPAAACGGSDEDAPVVPEGTHYGYVVSKITAPPSGTAAGTAEYGIDLGGSKSGTPDGAVDNKLGIALSTLSTFGFSVQPTIDETIDRGTALVLVDFQTKDFTNASASGLSVKLGATPTPAPCADANDTICRKHLAGTGTFTLSPNSPADATVSGKIVNGTFTGGPGEIALQLAIGSAQPITLNLVNARAKATGISEAGFKGIIAGAVLETEFKTQVLPLIQQTVAGILDTRCGVNRMPANNCGCTDSTTMNILSLFDKMPKDCNVSTEEINAEPTIKTGLAADVCSMKTCTAPDAISLGIKIEAVKATF